MTRATGADPKVLAAVIRGEIAGGVPAAQLREVEIPVLILNGTADVVNRKFARLLETMPTSRAADCEGDHATTPFQPTFQSAAVEFFGQARRAGAGRSAS
jgi:hypothetical protein